MSLTKKIGLYQLLKNYAKISRYEWNRHLQRMAYEDSMSEPRTRELTSLNLRILIVIPYSYSHPLFIRPRRKTWSASKAEHDGKEDKTMQCTRDDQCEPHAEVVDLGQSE